MKKLLTLCLIIAFASSNIVLAATTNPKGSNSAKTNGGNYL